MKMRRPAIILFAALVLSLATSQTEGGDASLEVPAVLADAAEEVAQIIPEAEPLVVDDLPQSGQDDIVDLAPDNNEADQHGEAVASQQAAEPPAVAERRPEYPIRELEDATWASMLSAARQGSEDTDSPSLDDETRLSLRKRLHGLFPFALNGLASFVPQPEGHVFTGHTAASATHLGEAVDAAGQEVPLSLEAAYAAGSGTLPDAAGAPGGPPTDRSALASMVALNLTELRAAAAQRGEDRRLMGQLAPGILPHLPEPPPIPAPAAQEGHGEGAFDSAQPGELPADVLAFARSEAVRRGFLHAWRAYETHAWGSDILRPLSPPRGDEDLCKMGMTIVDSLSTMLLMGLPGPYARARAWVAANLTFGGRGQENINLFETTIRIVGGLLSAHDLSGDALYRDKAAACMDAMIGAGAFESPSGLPWGTLTLWPQGHTESPVNLPGSGAVGSGGRGYAYNPGWQGGSSSLSEVTTLQVELEALTARTGKPVYAALGRRVMRALTAIDPPLGLFPIRVDNSGEAPRMLGDAVITLGARGDSAYEYLLKQWLLARGPEWAHERRISEATAAVALQLLLQRRAESLRALRAGSGASGDSGRAPSVSNAAEGSDASNGDGDNHSSEPEAHPSPAPSPGASGRSRLTILPSLASDSFMAAVRDAPRDDPRYLLSAYNKAVAGILDRLLLRSSPGRLWYIAEMARTPAATPGQDPPLVHKMDHLVCFLPGVLALGAQRGAGHEALAARAEGRIRRAAAQRTVGALLRWARGVADPAELIARATSTAHAGSAAGAGEGSAATPEEPAVHVPGLGIALPAVLLEQEEREGEGASRDATSASEGVTVDAGGGTAPGSGPSAGGSVNSTALARLLDLWGEAPWEQAPRGAPADAPMLDPSTDASPSPPEWLVEDVLHIMRQLRGLAQGWGGAPARDGVTSPWRVQRTAAEGLSLSRPRGVTAAQLAASADALAASDHERALAEAAARAAAEAASASPVAAPSATPEAAVPSAMPEVAVPSDGGPAPSEDEDEDEAARGTATGAPQDTEQARVLAEADAPAEGGGIGEVESATEPPPSPSPAPHVAAPDPTPPMGPAHDPSAVRFASLSDPDEAAAALMSAASGLTETCVAMYDRTSTGLAPEIVTFAPGADFAPNHDAKHCLLRPETTESLFLMGRLTGEPRWGEAAWRIFDSLERHARVRGGGYANLHDVAPWPLSPDGEAYSAGRANMDDKMESFFMAETMKYLFLAFSPPAALPLEEWVLNTEAHPVRLPQAPVPATEPRG